MEGNFNNKLEIFNEICILTVSYHLFLFTDFTDSNSLNLDLGWMLIAITGINIIANLTIIMTMSAVGLFKTIKEFY